MDSEIIRSNGRYPYAIITGMEHSGTTYLANLIKANSSHLNSGFECGILLSESSPENFHKISPFYDWLCMPIESGQWGLTQIERQFVCNTNSWTEFYKRLAEKSPAILKGQLILDKTPAYAYQLTNIAIKAPETPIFVTIKNIHLLYVSYKRRGTSLDKFAERYNKFINSVTEYKSTSRQSLNIICHKKLTNDPKTILKLILTKLELPIPPKIKLELPKNSPLPIKEDYNYDQELEMAHNQINTTERSTLKTIERQITCQTMD